jgi:murein DD-endopeptidase MepM/ murein hydrolase activator NlpD
MRLLNRCVVLCLMVIAVAAVPVTGAEAGGRRPSPTAADQPAPAAAAPLTAATLKARANQAAARYAAAQTLFARLGDQIDGLERQISDLEGRITPLRERITRQAVAVYQGDVAQAVVNRFDAVAASMRSDRSAHLAAELGSRDIPAIDALRATQQGIRDRRSELAVRQHDADVTRADLAAQQEQISAQLTAMAAALPPPPSRTPLPRVSRSAALGQRLLKGPAPAFVCPIAGPLAFTDDFGAPRGGGRRHMGNDLLSPAGTPNVAVVNGTIETRPWAGGGITIFLRGDDGNTYVYMHLMQIVGAVPRRVAQAEVIGLVGATGDARGYHTHFEFHPAGGDAVSPYPLLSAAC